MTQNDPDNDSRVRIIKPIKSIAIIGGGASGAIALDTLKSLDQFDEIVLYERRNVLGGVWCLDESPNLLKIEPGLDQQQLDPKLDIPQLQKEEKNVFIKKERPNQERFIHTASYENLKTNIPEQLMTFSDEKTWTTNDDSSLYVNKDYIRGIAIQKYIERYINRNKQHIVLNTTVESIDKDYSQENTKFKLSLRTELNETNNKGKPLDLWTEREFDSIILATGHYHVPYIPEVPGLKEIYQNFPHLISHSKTFRTTDNFQDQTVLIVGTRASGADICEIALEKNAKIVYQSQNSSTSALRRFNSDNFILKPKVVKYVIDNNNNNNNTVTVHFNDGTSVSNLDKIIYATGFRYSYPFLNDLYPNFTTGYIIPDLYLHTFFTKDPRLNIIGVPTDAISFRAFEFQAVLLSRFLAGLISLPSLKDQIIWNNQRFRSFGNTRAYHTIEFNGKLEYLQSLVELGGGVEPIDSRKLGRAFPQWTKNDLKKLDEIHETLIKFFASETPQQKQQKKSLFFRN